MFVSCAVLHIENTKDVCAFYSLTEVQEGRQGALWRRRIWAAFGILGFRALVLSRAWGQLGGRCSECSESPEANERSGRRRGCR